MLHTITSMTQYNLQLMQITGVGGHRMLSSTTMPFVSPMTLPSLGIGNRLGGQRHMMLGIAFNRTLRIMFLKDIFFRRIMLGI